MEDLLLPFGLLVLGYLLLAVEAFLIPGFGVFGIAGLLFVGGGCYAVWNSHGPAVGMAMIAATVLLTGLGLWLLSRSGTAQRMVLRHEIDGQATDREAMAGFIGKRGVAASDLRPSGSALFGEDRRQVMSDGEYIDAGQPIEVVRVSTNTLVVALVESPEEADKE